MPSSCCIPGCKFNYNCVLKQEQDVKVISLFQFSRDDNLRQKWLKAISRTNFISSKTAVGYCKHVPESQVIQDDNYLQPN